jgi:alpha-tubulin suppressor-like RCC1 family protein
VSQLTWLPAFAVAAAMCLLASCAADRTEILVVVDSDLEVPAVIDGVRIDVEPPEGEPVFATADLGEQPLPRVLGLVHDGGSLGPLLVTATGQKGVGDVVARTASVSFVEGRTLVLRMWLLADCVGTVCGEGLTCGDDGMCRDVLIQPDELLEWTGTPPRIDADGGADAPMDVPADQPPMDVPGDVPVDVPVDAGPGSLIVQVTANTRYDPSEEPGHTCGLRSSGEVVCWGRNTTGQLGTGDTRATASPVAVIGLADASQVSAGGSHTCAVRSTGVVVCWGDNDHGQLGNGTTDDQRMPTEVAGLSDAVQVMGGSRHTCARRATGEVVCWGRGDEGQIGNDDTSDAPMPAPVMGITDAVHIAAGQDHNCAAREDMSVVCWGEGGDGQLGDGGTGDERIPVLVEGLPAGAVSVGLGRYHSCAVLTDGRIACWGENDEGQLGDDSTSRRTRAVVVMKLSDAVEVGGGNRHTCARRTDSRILCWGRGSEGQLGHGMTTDERVPVMVPGLSGVTDLDVGSSHTCVVTATGGVACWGSNVNGQLGDGTTTGRDDPTEVPGLP